MAVDISSIYVHDGKLLTVAEDPACSTITFDVELPGIESELVSGTKSPLRPIGIVFEDVYGYRVQQVYMNGQPTLVDLSVVGNEGRRDWLRVDTGDGFREILCAGVKVVAVK